jgi:hypothetical protein
VLQFQGFSLGGGHQPRRQPIDILNPLPVSIELEPGLLETIGGIHIRESEVSADVVDQIRVSCHQISPRQLLTGEDIAPQFAVGTNLGDSPRNAQWRLFGGSTIDVPSLFRADHIICSRLLVGPRLTKNAYFDRLREKYGQIALSPRRFWMIASTRPSGHRIEQRRSDSLSRNPGDILRVTNRVDQSISHRENLLPKTLRAALAAHAVLCFALIGCGQNETTTGDDNIPAMYVDADGSHASKHRDSLHNAFPHMLMSNGAITLNDRCPVRKVPLNLRLPALFVNDKPIGFC